MSNPHFSIVEAALPISLGVLADRVGVKIQYGPFSTASTDLKSIRIPSLKDIPEARVIGLGYGLHEALHLRETDPNVELPKNPLVMDFFNTLEDHRIERIGMMMFKGAKDILNALTHYLVDREGPGGSPDPASSVMNAMLMELEFIRFGGDRLKDRAQRGWDDLFQFFPAPAQVGQRLMILLARADRLTDTASALALAEQVYAMLKDEKQKSEERQNSQEQSQNQKSDASCDQGTKGQNERSDPKGSSTGDPSKDDDSDDDSDASGSGHGAGSSQDEAEITQNLNEALGSQGVSQARDELEAMLNQHASKDSDDRDFYPATPRDIYFDGTSNLESIRDAERVSNLAARKLKVLLESTARKGRRLSSDASKIRGNRMHRVAIGDPRIFEKRTQTKFVNTAVQIIFDRSGSMSNSIQLASNAALATALAVTANRGCNVQVAAFPVDNSSDGVFVLSRFDEPVKATAARYPVIGTAGFTPMTQALLFGVKEMVTRPEPRKIMIVVTDGAPDNRESTKRAIALAEKYGIEMVGVGIGYDVSKLFARSRFIHEINELPDCLIGALMGLFKGNKAA